MKAIILKCRPGSRFHFGKYAPDADTALNDSSEIMHSDTLLAALLNTYQELLGNAQPLVNAIHAGQINISSLFYCFEQEQQYTWLLPKPACFDLFGDSTRPKIFKGVQWISKGVWETLTHPGELLTSGEVVLAAKGKIALLAEEIKLPAGVTVAEKEYLGLRHMEQDTLPKVLVRGNIDERTIYQLTVNEIADNNKLIAGLQVHYYFLLQNSETADPSVLKNLEQVFSIIHWQGIGAERSTIGQLAGMEIVNGWQINPGAMHNEYAATASLYAPLPEEMDGLLFYHTLLRGGRRLGHNHTEDNKNRYLKTLRMVQEGAIVNRAASGCLGDVSPLADKSFLRHGMAFCLPIPQTWIPQQP